MRLSRKRARRIAEERAKEEAQARAEAERAAKAAAAAQARYEAACKGATMPSRRYPHSRRQNRRTRRAYLLEKARAHFARQAAMTAAFSTACLTRLLGTASAGYHDPMHDVASEFASLRDERDEIRNAQAARQYLQAARESLANARHDLADATAAVADAQTSVADATKNLADSQQALAQTKEYLRNARAVSAQRTREAIAAQQAAYDYLQELYARQAMVDQLSAEQVSAIGPVDVLLVPVGGFYTVGAEEAKAVVRQIGPRCAVPMHYRHAPHGLANVGGVERFLDLFCSGDVTALPGPSFTVTAETRGILVPAYWG